MHVWIVNYYNGTPANMWNPRYIVLAKYFKENGWDVTLFNASYVDDALAEEFENRKQFLKKKYGEYDFVHVKAPRYKGNGFGRMKSIFCFAWTIKKYCDDFERPDVILHNIHTPFDYPIVWAAKKLNAKYVAEAWDAWPDVFAHLGMVSRSNPAFNFFEWAERKLYQNADQIVFTILGMKERIRQKGWSTETGGKIDLNHVHYINNGIDLEQFDKDRECWPRNDEDLLDPKTLKVVYLGSVNRANHVHTLIEAAKLLQSIRAYRFFIYGDGDDRELLEKKVRDEGINNVVFKEKRIPLCECAWVVSQATVNVMNYQKGFGYMGVSSGKMFQYLAAGKPILCNVDIVYDNVIRDNNLGFAQDIESPEAFSEMIRKLAEQPRASYDAMCERVRKTAERFDYKKLAAEEMSVIEAAIKG